jgi:putative transposase
MLLYSLYKTTKLSKSCLTLILDLGATSIFNPDKGTPYTGKVFTGALKNHGVQISMDGKGHCRDNILIERLLRLVKCEKIFLEEFETVPELLLGLKEYFKFYNFERPHQSLVGNKPEEIYWGSEVARKAA